MTNIIEPESFIVESIGFIRSCGNEIARNIYLAGERLYAVRELLKQDRRWMAFLAELELSPDTASRWINVYERGQAFIDHPMPLRVLYAIVAPSVDDDTRNTLSDLLDTGQSVSADTLYLYQRAPSYLVRSVEGGLIDEARAVETAKQIADSATPDEARGVCLRYNVHDPDMAEYIIRKAREGSETFLDIASNGYLNMSDGSVSIMYATQVDIDRYNREKRDAIISESVPLYRWDAVVMTINKLGDMVYLSMPLDGFPIDLSQFEDGLPVNVKWKVKNEE